MVFQHLPWQLTCALFTMASAVSAASINPTNSSSAIGTWQGSINLQTSNGANLSQLVPLTRDAIMRNGAPIQGNLHYTTYETLPQIVNTDIAYLSCEPSDYKGNMGAYELFGQAMDSQSRNLTAIILYSKVSDFCDFDGQNDQNQEFPVFSMTKKEQSEVIYNEVLDSSTSPAKKYFVNIVGDGNGSRQGDGNGRQGQQSPLGPSPSTAVAMIILYSITGIITALFLVIIVTGAVRAHRHPDRYGPRDMLGRPRQSRARGLGRAILDTIPIVKFGEREPPKPADVEMGSTAEARNVNSDDTTGTAAEAEPNAQPGTETSPPTNPTDTPRDLTNDHPSASGIAPALATAAAVSQEQKHDEHLGCSICTDDFEKGQDIRVLPCDHKFHPECVDPWLLNVSGTCPLCRVDLRPTTTNSSDNAADDENPDSMPPPLQPETDTSHRRRSALRDILSLRSRPNASAEERISALRRLREQRRNGSGEVADAASGSGNGSAEDVSAATNRRSRRISRFSGVFSGRRRGGDADASPSATAAPVESAGVAVNAAPANANAENGASTTESTAERRT